MTDRDVENNETDWERRALAAEGLLTFALLTLGRPVVINKKTVDGGFPEGVEIYTDFDMDEETMEVGLTKWQ